MVWPMHTLNRIRREARCSCTLVLFQAEDGIRDYVRRLEFRRVLFRATPSAATAKQRKESQMNTTSRASLSRRAVGRRKLGTGSSRGSVMFMSGGFLAPGVEGLCTWLRVWEGSRDGRRYHGPRLAEAFGQARARVHDDRGKGAAA